MPVEETKFMLVRQLDHYPLFFAPGLGKISLEWKGSSLTTKVHNMYRYGR